MSVLIENRAIQHLEEYCKKNGLVFERLTKQKFDGKINGKFIEIKSKSKPFSQLEEIDFEESQYNATISNQPEDDYTLWLITNLGSENNPKSFAEIEFHTVSKQELKKIIHESKKRTEYTLSGSRLKKSGINIVQVQTE